MLQGLEIPTLFGVSVNNVPNQSGLEVGDNINYMRHSLYVGRVVYMLRKRTNQCTLTLLHI